ncbi:MAG: hypothetical protein JSS64_03065 [Bacteroidetes bacterium]|nr:hypothetical protein [Bacteroidota bacterium]
MTIFKKHISFFFSGAILVIAVWLLYPHFQYYVDPDSTAYLTLAKRYVEGDYDSAINGYWSPFSIWLVALGMKAGFNAMPSAVVVNALAAIGFLYLSHLFFRKLFLKKMSCWLLEMALSVFLTYAVYWQLFADLWGCFFLLWVLYELLRETFIKNKVNWLLVGLLGALAYLSKAYSLPFFVLEIIVFAWFFMRKNDKPTKASLTFVFGVVGTLFLCALPWFLLLHQKYGIWTTGTAGMLNTSWYLVGHPYWKHNVGAILPPVYANSPSYWEDPFRANGATPHFWNSMKLFTLQIIRIGYNSLKFLQSISELSIFFSVAIVVAFFQIRKNLSTLFFEPQHKFLSVSFLLFPLGYFLINFEARYLWFMVPLGMVLLVKTIEMIADRLKINMNGLVALLAFSFMAYPIVGLKKMYGLGLDDHEIACKIKQAGIKGGLTSNIPYGVETQRLMRISFFANMPFYTLPFAVPKSKLVDEMDRYGILYLISVQPCWPMESNSGFKKIPVDTASDIELWQRENKETR